MSRFSRAQAFEDFLHMTVCALGNPLMEDAYLQAVERHTVGQKGKRGCDLLAKMFSRLVHVMDETGQDILGDLFQGAITNGESGQFLLLEPICQMMAKMYLPEEQAGNESRKTVGDRCCGSGRMLLAAAEIQPNWHFVGQDVDLRCVRMKAINLGLLNIYGLVIWGDSIKKVKWQVYETGRLQVLNNVIRKVTLLETPEVVMQIKE